MFKVTESGNYALFKNFFVTFPIKRGNPGSILNDNLTDAYCFRSKAYNHCKRDCPK